MHIRPTPGARREPDPVEVVLVETDDWAEIADGMGVGGSDELADGPEGDASGDGADRRRRPPRHPRRWYVWRTTVAAVVVLLVVVVVNVVDERRHDAQIAALGTIAGFLAPMTGPPTEQWRVPGGLTGEASGLLLVTDLTERTVTGVDPVTGTARWTFADAGVTAVVSCQVVREAGGDLATSAGPPPASTSADRDVVACVADLPRPSGAQAPPVPTIVLVDARTGASLGSYEVDDTLVLMQTVGTDLLVGSVRADGRLHVVRLDPRTAEPRWSYTSPVAMFGRDPLMLRSADRRGDALVVTALGGTSAISLTTGAAVDPAEATLEPSTSESMSLPGGRTATWRWNATGTSGRGQVTEVGGRRAYSLTGPVQRPVVRDASVPQTLVLASITGTRLRGVNLRTGRQLWSTEVGPASSHHPVVQVSGVMLLGGQDTVKALDLRDGSVRWAVPSDSAVHGSGLTDGEDVLVVRGEEAGPVLTAVELDDGARVWRADLPPGTVSLAAVGGRLFAETQDAVVALS